MGLSKIGGLGGLGDIGASLFQQERYLLTGLPALDDVLTDSLGLTRKQVIATASDRNQHEESLLALYIADQVIRAYDVNVLALSCSSRKEYQALAKDFGRFGSDARDCDEAVLRLGRQLVVENPRSWQNFEADLADMLAAVEPGLILIESPDVVLPCTQAWEYVLQKQKHHDPWGSLARRVKALSERAGCPVWVFGELCYSLKFIDHLYTDMLPQAETSWRSCAQLEAYLSYWDCVIQVGESAGKISVSSLKNRLGASFSKVVL